MADSDGDQPQGLLDVGRLATMGEGDLAELLDGLTVRPRYGAKLGAMTLSDAVRLVAGRFGGDARAIWQNSSPAEVEGGTVGGRGMLNANLTDIAAKNAAWGEMGNQRRLNRHAPANDNDGRKGSVLRTG